MPSVGRSVRGAYALYLEKQGRKKASSSAGSPSPFFRDWANNFRWEERAAARDKHCRDEERASSRTAMEEIRALAMDGLKSAITLGNYDLANARPSEKASWVNSLLQALKYFDSQGVGEVESLAEAVAAIGLDDEDAIRILRDKIGDLIREKTG